MAKTSQKRGLIALRVYHWADPFIIESNISMDRILVDGTGYGEVLGGGRGPHWVLQYGTVLWVRDLDIQGVFGAQVIGHGSFIVGYKYIQGYQN